MYGLTEDADGADTKCHLLRVWIMQEWEISKMKQDKHLDSIERGLGTLGEVATAMGEGLKHQDVLIDAVDEKVLFTLIPPGHSYF
jgi:hypothetical protein